MAELTQQQWTYIEQKRGNEWKTMIKKKLWMLKVEKTSETTFGDPADRPIRIPGAKAQKSVFKKPPREFIDGQLEGQENSITSCSRKVRWLEGKERAFWFHA